jgi:hypothetical protein
MNKRVRLKDGDVIGRIGALARAQKLSPRRRSEIAKKAALTRWAGHVKRSKTKV